MDLEAAFLGAALPEPVILLHQPLRPYSLGHRLLLRRNRSPFLDAKSPPPQIEDLYLAAYICCHTYDQACAELRKPQDIFGREINSWRKLCGEFDPEPIFQAFMKYLEDGSSMPQFSAIIRAGQTRAQPPGAPWDAILLATLLGLGYSRSDALDCPYGLAQWLYCVHLELQGSIRIISDSRKANLARIRTEAERLGWKPIKWHSAGGVESAHPPAEPPAPKTPPADPLNPEASA